MPPTSRQLVELQLGAEEAVPAILQLPSARPAPAVLLIHGFSSRKESMADSLGRALAARGVASLAIDLPLHGARDGGVEGMSLRNPLALVQKWRLAVKESSNALEYLADHPAIDPQRIGLSGYSLGSYIGVIVASSSRRVRAVALAAGGDLPAETPFASLVRTIADPIRAVRSLAGRPLLMVNGRYDRTIRPEQAKALFAAAAEPKEQRWYNGGHWPPVHAIDETAAWLTTQLSRSDIQSRLA
jgi:dienelactone hydrolase